MIYIFCPSFLIDQKSILAFFIVPVIFEGNAKKGAAGKGSKDVLGVFIDRQRVSGCHISLKTNGLNVSAHKVCFGISVLKCMFPF